jgi:hypothetical protein
MFKGLAVSPLPSDNVQRRSLVRITALRKIWMRVCSAVLETTF